MNFVRKKDHVYDVIIVGAGLPGLVAATELVLRGLDICVLESADFPGGHSRLVFSPLGLVDNGLKFFPDQPASHEALEILKRLTAKPFEIFKIENGPITYHNGEMKPFVGFGKEAPAFHRGLSYFLEPHRLEISRRLGQLTADLVARLGDRVQSGAIVTKYLGANGQIETIMINGQKTMSARAVVHAASPKLLATLLADDVLSSRSKQKLAKADYWTILGLDLFHHGLISDRTELHLLNGTTQDDLGPCVGLFHAAVPSEKVNGELLQHSQWMTFIELEDSEDPEIVGAVLKKIKRQIKRAYPEAFEKIFSERILVAPMAEAELDLKWDRQGAFAGVGNLWLAHGSASEELNLVGSIRRGSIVADQVAAALGVVAATAPASLEESATHAPFEA